MTDFFDRLRRTKFATTVCKINFCENIVPLARQRCVESPHPTSCVSINYCKFCVRMISATVAYGLFYFERRKTPSQPSPTTASKKLQKIFKKSVTFFIFADYIYGTLNSGKSLFLHVLSILLHRRLHRTQFCIIIYPERRAYGKIYCRLFRIFAA